MVNGRRTWTLAAVLCVAALGLSGCPPAGTTCGYGRCHAGACLNVISTYGDQKKPLLDWWCAVPCDGKATCAGELCLQSPVDSNLNLCAGDQLEVKYLYSGGEIPQPDGKVRLTDFRILRPGRPTKTCEPDKVCSAGWFHTGEYLPTLFGTTTTGDSVHLVNGSPGEVLEAAASSPDGETRAPLGPLLPTGLNIVVHIDGNVAQLF